MDSPITARATRSDRLAALEDALRRRLWARKREGHERDFDDMIAEIARQQYSAESQVSRARDPCASTLAFFGGPNDGKTVPAPAGEPAIAMQPEGCKHGFYVWHPEPRRYEWVEVPPAPGQMER